MATESWFLGHRQRFFYAIELGKKDSSNCIFYFSPKNDWFDDFLALNPLGSRMKWSFSQKSLNERKCNWTDGQVFLQQCAVPQEKKNDNYGKKTHNEAKIMFEFVFKFETMSYSKLITCFHTKSETTKLSSFVFLWGRNFSLTSKSNK